MSHGVSQSTKSRSQGGRPGHGNQPACSCLGPWPPLGCQQLPAKSVCVGGRALSEALHRRPLGSAEARAAEHPLQREGQEDTWFAWARAPGGAASSLGAGRALWPHRAQPRASVWAKPALLLSEAGESGTQGLSPSSLGVQESHQLVLTVQGGLGGPRGQGPWPGQGEQKVGCWVGVKHRRGQAGREGTPWPAASPPASLPEPAPFLPPACPCLPLPAPSPSSRNHTFNIQGRSPIAPGPRDITRLPVHSPTCGGTRTSGVWFYYDFRTRPAHL